MRCVARRIEREGRRRLPADLVLSFLRHSREIGRVDNAPGIVQSCLGARRPAPMESGSRRGECCGPMDSRLCGNDELGRGRKLSDDPTEGALAGSGRDPHPPGHAARTPARRRHLRRAGQRQVDPRQWPAAWPECGRDRRGDAVDRRPLPDAGRARAASASARSIPLLRTRGVPRHP